MKNLSKYFKQDIVSNSQSLKPVIVIPELYHDQNTTPEYYLRSLFTFTINQENLIQRWPYTDLPDKPLNQIPCIKSVSNIKTSSDYDKKTLKINTLRFTLYNYYDENTKLSEYVDFSFNDLIGDEILNKPIYLFYKSPTTNVINFYPNVEVTDPEDFFDKNCALIYKGEISRVESDNETISITVEDKTQTKISNKIVPYMDLDKLPANIKNNIPESYKKSSDTVPMVFGKVDKSPIIPYIDTADPKNLSLLMDFLPTSTNFKTSKIPSLISQNNLPSGDPYYLYVKSGEDYIILDHYSATINYQASKYSRVEVILTGQLPDSYILPQLVEDPVSGFGIYDFIGFQQRMVQRSYATEGSILDANSLEISNLNADSMFNLESIDSNRGFRKKWYRAGDGLISGNQNTNFKRGYIEAGGAYDGLIEGNTSNSTSAGEGFYIILKLEEGVSNELANIYIDNMFAGNTFALSDYRLEGVVVNSDQSQVDTDQSGEVQSLGLYISPINNAVWETIKAIQGFYPDSETVPVDLQNSRQATLEALLAETDDQLTSLAENPDTALGSIISDPTQPYNMSAIRVLSTNPSDFNVEQNVVGDNKYWGESGNVNTLNDTSEYSSINGLYFGAKTTENQDILVGESPDAHNNLIMFSYFPPHWVSPLVSNTFSASYFLGLSMNNIGFLHSVKVEDIRKQKIYASIEGRKNHLFTEQLDQESYNIGEMPDIIDAPLDLFTKNSDGSSINHGVVLSSMRNLFKELIDDYAPTQDNTKPTYSEIYNGDVLGELYSSESVGGTDISAYEAQWDEATLGGGTGFTYNLNDSAVDYNETGGLSSDSYPISWSFNDVSSLWTTDNFDGAVQNLWQEKIDFLTLTGDDALMLTNYTLFKDFIYRACLIPVQLAHSWNFLYDTRGHPINIWELFGKKFMIKEILQYVFQEEFVGLPQNFDLSYWYRLTFYDYYDPARLLKITQNIETKLESRRDYSWNSFGSGEGGAIETIGEWHNYFYVYMDDLTTAFNDCIRDLEAEISPDYLWSDGYGKYFHYDNEYMDDGPDEVEWTARGEGFDNWVSGNQWYYGISFYETITPLSGLITELLTSAGLTEELDSSVETTTSGIITKPSDIVMNILTSEMDYGKFSRYFGDATIGVDILKPDYDYFDIEKIEESRQEHSGWNMGFSINKKTNGKRLIEDILKESKSYPTFTPDGKFSLITIKGEYDDSDVDKKININDIIKYKFTQTKKEDVITSVKAYYRYDNGLKDYGSYVEKSIVDVFPSFIDDSILDPLAGHKEIKLKYHTDKSTVEDFVDYILYNNCNQHLVCDLTLALNNIDLSIGDVIHIPIIKNEKAFNIDYSVPAIVNDQGIYPYWIVMETNTSVSSVTIKAVQLHLLSSEAIDLNPTVDIVGNTEPLNTNGYVFTTGEPLPNWNFNPLATINSGIQIPYFDINQDGILNVVDIIIGVNMVLGDHVPTPTEMALLTTFGQSPNNPPNPIINVVTIVTLVNLTLAAE